MEREHISYKLITLTNLIKREIDKSMSMIEKNGRKKFGCGFTGSNIQVIRFLYENRDKEIYQKDIEAHFSLTAPTVSANLRLMEKNGLITRQYSTEDTRLKIVMLTKNAIEMETMIRSRIIPIEEKLNHALTDEEQKQIIVLLDKLKFEFE